MSEPIHKSHNVSALHYHAVCSTKYRRSVITEVWQAALAALEKVLACPDSVAEATALHRKGARAAKLTPDEARRRLRELDAALIQLKGEEQSAVTAWLAGIWALSLRPTRRCSRASRRGARTWMRSGGALRPATPP